MSSATVETVRTKRRVSMGGVLSRPAILLFLAACLLYLPGLWWGLPHATAPDRVAAWGSDELAPLGPVAELYSVATRSSTFNPQYPLFHYVAEAAFVGPYVGFLMATGQMSSPSVVYPFGLADPVRSLAMMALLARLVNLLMAAGVVVAAFLTATSLWDKRTGVLAGILVMLSYSMFYYARTSNVDMGALFWTSLGLLVYVRCLREALTVRRALALGTFAALAIASKDASYAVFVALAAVILIRFGWPGQGMTGFRYGSWKQMGWALLASVVVYAVASGAVLHPEKFVAHVRFITHGSEATGHDFFYYSVPATIGGYLRLSGEIATHTADAIGLPMLVAAASGLLICARRSPRALLAAVPILGVVLGVIFPVRFVLFRFVLVIAYVAALYAAYALGIALQQHAGIKRRMAVAAVAIVAGWAFVRGADLTHQMLNDSRYELAAWLQEHARPGDYVGYYGAPQKLPPLERGIETVPMPGQLGAQREDVSTIRPDFVVVIPQQPFEGEHEWSLPEADYEALKSGRSGYERAFATRTASLFSRRVIPFVNPPVQAFVRTD